MDYIDDYYDAGFFSDNDTEIVGVLYVVSNRTYINMYIVMKRIIIELEE